MKIIESEEESTENRKGSVEIESHDGRDESQGSDNTPDSNVMFGKGGTLSEDISDDGNPTGETGENQVPVVTPRGRGRPRKITVTTDGVSPLAKVSATPSRGRGRPRKETSVTNSPLVKDSPFPSERRGRGRPRKVIDASFVIKSEKPDDPENVGIKHIKQEADSVPRRGRGRPRKNFGSFGASTSFTGGKTSSIPRRGRGRPRKIFKNMGPMSSLAKGRIGHQNDFRRLGAIELLAQALAKQGRGRPRKGTGIKDAVQLLQKDPSLPKRGRGRPPKSIKRIFAMKLLAKAAGTARRGRGRPRKVIPGVAKVSEGGPSVAPRGRGRPRKNFGTPNTSLLPSKAPATTPRGRGRPRKNLATVDTAVLSSKATEPVAETKGIVENVSDVPAPQNTINSHSIAPSDMQHIFKSSFSDVKEEPQ